MQKAVFLDRDGVINRAIVRDGKPYAPREMSGFELLPQVEEAISNLADANFLIFVVTNQPDIGNGFISLDIVEQMHKQFLQNLPIKKIYICAHRQDEGCDCRKPKPGMLLKAKEEFNIDMSASYMIGDRYGDVCAGQNAGCISIFIDNDYVETPDFDVNMRANSLYEASKYILGKKQHD
jgi:D-glycero-D-manno-heptose 1,7-bisphosphate phosphatase